MGVVGPSVVVTNAAWSTVNRELNSLERLAIEGDSPVSGSDLPLDGTRVPRDT